MFIQSDLPSAASDCPAHISCWPSPRLPGQDQHNDQCAEKDVRWIWSEVLAENCCDLAHNQLEWWIQRLANQFNVAGLGKVANVEQPLHCGIQCYKPAYE